MTIGPIHASVIGLLASGVLILAVSACGGDDASGEGDSSSDLAGTSWTLASASIDGEDTGSVATATLTFDRDGTTIAGSTGCNQFTGTYEQEGADLTITLGPVTLAACVDPALTAQEAAILAHLPATAAFTSEDQLVLEDSSGEALLTYDAGVSTIAGTSWTATGVNNGTGGVERNAATETITAEFGTDGTLSGFSGCNNYNASYTLTADDAVSITGVSSTRMACEEPAMTVESQYLTALENAVTFELSGDTLTLRDADGSAQVTYAIAS